MTKRTNHPTKRLKMHSVGDTVTLKGAGVSKPYKVTKIRDDGYYELCNERGRLVFTASKCHEVE